MNNEISADQIANQARNTLSEADLDALDTHRAGLFAEGNPLAGPLSMGLAVLTQLIRVGNETPAQSPFLSALHRALRVVLGQHVTERGSYVGPDRLTLDFTHTAPLRVEERRAVDFRANTSLISSGSMLKIVDDLSVCKGVRRIEAVTGRTAEDLARAGAIWLAQRPAPAPHVAPAIIAPHLAGELFARLEALLSGIPVRRMRLLRLGWSDACLDEQGIPMEPGEAQAWLAGRLVGELRQHPQGVQIGLTRLVEWADAGLSVDSDSQVQGLRVELAEAHDRLALCTAEMQRLRGRPADPLPVVFCPCGAEARDGGELIHLAGCPFVGLPPCVGAP